MEGIREDRRERSVLIQKLESWSSSSLITVTHLFRTKSTYNLRLVCKLCQDFEHVVERGL